MPDSDGWEDTPDPIVSSSNFGTVVERTPRIIRSAGKVYKGNLRRDLGQVDKIVIGTDRIVDGHHVRPVILTANELENLQKGALSRKLQDGGLDPDALHKEVNKFYVQPKGSTGEGEAKRAAVSILAAKLEWDKKKQFDTMVDRIKVGSIKFGLIRPNEVTDAWTRRNIWGETVKPEVQATRNITDIARTKMMDTPIKDFEEKMRGIKPETNWYENTKKRYGGTPHGVREYLLKKNFSVTRGGYKDDPANMALASFLSKEDIQKATEGVLTTNQDPFNKNVLSIKPPYTPEQVRTFEDAKQLGDIAKKMDSHRHRTIMGEYSKTYLDGERDPVVILRDAHEHPERYKDIAQIVMKSPAGAGMSIGFVENDVRMATGVSMPLGLEKREVNEMNPPKQKSTFIKGVAKAAGMDEKAFRNTPYYKKIYNMIRDGSISENEIADINLNENYDDWAKDHSFDYYDLKQAAGVHKIREDTLKRWPGGVHNVPDDLGSSGSGSSGKKGSSGGTFEFGGKKKREDVISGGKGALFSPASAFTRKEAIEVPGEHRYQEVTRRGALSPFRTPGEKKQQYKEMKESVQKTSDALVKRKLGPLTAAERRTLENKWRPFSGWNAKAREKELQKIIQRHEKEVEKENLKYNKYAGAVGREEALKLALPSKEGGYGYFTKWWHTNGWGGAKGQYAHEWKRQKSISKETERAGIWGAQAIKQTRLANERKSIAASKWRSGWAGLKQGTKWAIIAVCAVALLFLPVGLFYVVGWAMAVALVELIQVIVWVFISIWFIIGEGIVSFIGALGQLFIGLINAMFSALTGWMGQPYQPFAWQWIQNMPMFAQDAQGNWILLTYTDASGHRQMITWGMANLVPPSFLNLNNFMPKTFDTNALIAYIVPPLKDWFHWFYGPIAEAYTNWIANQPWYIVGAMAGAPILAAIIVIGILYWYYAAKVKPRMY